MITMSEAASRVQERMMRTERGSGEDGIRQMLAEVGVDVDEGMDAIRGLAAMPIGSGADERVALTCATVAFITGYEVGFEADR